MYLQGELGREVWDELGREVWGEVGGRCGVNRRGMDSYMWGEVGEGGKQRCVLNCLILYLCTGEHSFLFLFSTGLGVSLRSGMSLRQAPWGVPF